ncbi:MAG: hypothetical protein HOK21_08690 [Rhodospirillaceae bacterium]|jgi:hypothetical protein|nr:hypothetical protein [Rhodospirillaceae bacterium]MBT4044483.1 hypothetical protein [Rhodospirillaceae bacterium]MBT5082688.1 hypothetical protein [Rhodospirillaceae bacterium]MBT5524148.1 hypothetical protein [Rhodospirillaceae bacterium]MBT5879780.1 hypothetical protein [Rhodospirillaceae bacterium]
MSIKLPAAAIPIMLLLACTMLPGKASAGAADAGQELAGATALRCVFKVAVETVRAHGEYKNRPTNGFSYTIDDIVTARGNAKAVSPHGSSHLEMVALPNVRHFIGFTAGGDINLTTVQAQFGRDETELLAVHSVHMASVPPKTFQHFGACKPMAKK